MNTASKSGGRRKLAALALVALLAWLSSTSASGLAGDTTARQRGEPAWDVAASLPTVGGTWTELTTHPYDLEDPDHRNYEQYFWGSGYGLAGGRVTASAN